MRAFLMTLTVVALLATPDFVSAKGRSCPKLCRKPIKECKTQCTGSKRERASCRLACKVIYKRVCHEYTGPSCTPPLLECGATPLTCTLIAINFTGWRPNDASGLPADFPAAPATSTLCGGVQQSSTTGAITFAAYLSSDDPNSVISQYSSGLIAAGYEVTENASSLDPTRRACDRGFRITRNGTTAGGLYYFVSQSAYLIVSGNTVTPPAKR